MKKICFLFPGQGSQKIGMGSNISGFSEYEMLFKKANHILGYDLEKICIEGPEEQLNSTIISQPAIFVISAILLELLNSKLKLEPYAVAGLSLGEYSSLYSAGIINFEDTLNLVKKRGELMEKASNITNGGMVSIIGLNEKEVKKLCIEAGQGKLLEPVNFNCPGQIVISGDIEACEKSIKLSKRYGAIKAIKLNVNGAFHTKMMISAVEGLKKELKNCNVKKINKIKIISNIDAEYYENSEQIKEGLVKQLINPILWQKCIKKLIRDGVEEFYEIGPGRVLTGLIKRIDRKIKIVNVNDVLKSF